MTRFETTEWESINKTLSRIPIPEGWLVKGYFPDDEHHGIALCIIKDPEHIWLKETID